MEGNNFFNIDIKGTVFNFDGNKQVILKRKKGLDKKPLYYVFNLTSKKYLSSLYPTGEPNAYLFDIRGSYNSYMIKFFNEGGNITYKIEKK